MSTIGKVMSQLVPEGARVVETSTRTHRHAPYPNRDGGTSTTTTTTGYDVNGDNKADLFVHEHASSGGNRWTSFNGKIDGAKRTLVDRNNDGRADESVTLRRNFRMTERDRNHDGRRDEVSFEREWPTNRNDTVALRTYSDENFDGRFDVKRTVESYRLEPITGPYGFVGYTPPEKESINIPVDRDVDP
jgi:hypothetical protein